MCDNASSKPSLKSQLGILLNPKNLLKTLGSLAPGSSIPIEMLNQLDGERVDARIAQVEAQVSQFANKPDNAASGGLLDWSAAAGQFMPRLVNIALAFDGGFHGAQFRGKERYNTVGHGCAIGDMEVVTCREVMELLTGAISHKGGRGVAIIGMAWYDFEAGPIDEASGLCILKLTKRDETKWSYVQQGLVKIEMQPLKDTTPTLTAVKHSVMPWIGHEIAFFHTGEADNASSLMSFEHLQFDTTTISHFRRKPQGSLKTFVSGVLGGRIVYAGVPVFSRDATLLGLVSDTESYTSDSGRRAVVRSLLGHPRFTNFQSSKK